MTFKEEVAIGLLKKGWNRKQLSQELGISYYRLSSYLNGFEQIPSELYSQIDDLLGLREERKYQKQLLKK